MKIENLKITNLLPQFMQDDPYFQALSETLENNIKKIYSQFDRIQLFGKFEQLTDEELDELANEINIPWYRTNLDRSKKIQIIKNAYELTKKQGTVKALEAVLNDIFGSCNIQEWFDYGGLPHHFKVAVANGENLNEENYNRLMYLIERVKRKSQWLDEMYSNYQVTCFVRSINAIIDTQIEKVKMVIPTEYIEGEE